MSQIVIPIYFDYASTLCYVAWRIVGQLEPELGFTALWKGVPIALRNYLQKGGFVLVGSVPTKDGTSATIQPGSLLVINRSGSQIAEWTPTMAKINGPWDLTIFDQGDHAKVFVSNVLDGTVTRLDVSVDDDLIETDFGAWEGLTFGEAAERDPELHRRWLRDTSINPPDGESFDSVADRVRRAKARITNEHSGETVLVVSHVTPIKTMLRLALDAGQGILYRLHLDLASLSIAEFYPDGVASVRLVNQTAYL